MIWRIAHSESSMGWGGQEHRVIQELVGFQKLGAEVWLLAPDQSQIYGRAQRLGIPVKKVEFGRARFVPNVFSLARWLKAHQIQVLNPHSSKDGWVLGIAGRLAKTPLIIRTRHIDVDYPNRFISRHAFTTFCDHVLTTSDRITAHFQKIFGIAADRITTVPTGIDLQKFSPAGAKADLQSFGVPVGAKLVGMISVLRSWKGHPVFLEAAEQLLKLGMNAHFLIVGEGPQRENIMNEIARRELQGQVTLLGHREDVPELLRALDVLVIPSTKHEGVPQIGLQALATKTPVVGSDAGGIPQIIRHGETGRSVPSGQPDALASAIREALENPDASSAMADRGRERVEDSHSVEAMLARLNDIYRRYLAA